MSRKGKLTVRFALNMCAVDPDEMPKNGMIVVPARPAGSWYGVCSNASLAGTLSQELQGTPETPMGEFLVSGFRAGEESNQAQLKFHLEQIGYQVVFANKPPWMH
jgi:hypothetical protein